MSMPIRTIAALRGFVATLVVAWLASAAVAEDNWRDFQMPDADFVVALPGVPLPATNNADPSGVTFRQYILERTPFTFSVSYLVFPPGTVVRASPKKVIDVARDALVKDYGAAVRGEKAVYFTGSAAREITFDLPPSGGQPGGIARVRVYVRGDRQYTLMVLTSRGFEKNPGIERFLESFRVLKQ